MHDDGRPDLSAEAFLRSAIRMRDDGVRILEEARARRASSAELRSLERLLEKAEKLVRLAEVKAGRR